MPKSFLLCFLLLILSSFCDAQSLQRGKLNSGGIEVQAYPAGVTFSATSAFQLNQKNEIMARIGYNLARRKDFGKHSNEEGGGFGLGTGWKHSINPAQNGIYYGIRTSLWFMNIDWQDESPFRSGSTYITVLQPTVMAGYDFKFANTFKAGFFLAFGYEINIITSGDPVGEGGISMAGVHFSYLFQ